MKITELSVIIVEDHSIVMEGLNSILQNVEGLQITGNFADAESAQAFLHTHHPHVVLLDISLPKASGIELCKVIKKINRDIKVIALTNHTEKSVIIEMLQSGADGYLLKNTSRDDLITAIFQAVNNQFTMKSELQKVLFSADINTAAIPRLTSREKEVLKLVSNGITTSSIANQLFISPQTVETHRRNLMQKFEVNNAAALTRKAIEYGLL